MKTFHDIAVLNYNSATVDVYSLEIDTFFSEEDQYVDFLKAKGYKLSEISWMTSINIDIHDERGGANG